EGAPIKTRSVPSAAMELMGAGLVMVVSNLALCAKPANGAGRQTRVGILERQVFMELGFVKQSSALTATPARGNRPAITAWGIPQKLPRPGKSKRQPRVFT